MKRIDREDVIVNCMYNIKQVTDPSEKEVAKVELDITDTTNSEVGQAMWSSNRDRCSYE